MSFVLYKERISFLCRDILARTDLSRYTYITYWSQVV